MTSGPLRVAYPSRTITPKGHLCPFSSFHPVILGMIPASPFHTQLISYFMIRISNFRRIILLEEKEGSPSNKTLTEISPSQTPFILHPTNKSTATKEHQLRLIYTDHFPKIGKKMIEQVLQKKLGEKVWNGCDPSLFMVLWFTILNESVNHPVRRVAKE